MFAGLSHLFWARQEFAAQVPTWMPLDTDLVVVASGVVEVVLGLALIAVTRYRVAVGWVTALFFVAVFPGNISVRHAQTLSVWTPIGHEVSGCCSSHCW